MTEFEFRPETYCDVTDEIPAYLRLQDAVADACAGPAGCALELGVGTGTTATAVLAKAPGIHLVGVDASAAMLAAAREALPDADLRQQALEDDLPDGEFDLVFSALAVHHLDGPGKQGLFERVAARLVPGGWFVLGDLIVPEGPADAVTPIDGIVDTPSRVGEQVAWLEGAGLQSSVTWSERDLAVVRARRSA